MRLWVDDIRPKPIEFDISVDNASDAIALLRTGTVTEISLDHDLGDDSMGTGMDIAKWVEEAAFNGTLPKLVWHVHSANPVGRKNMMLALANADIYWDKTGLI